MLRRIWAAVERIIPRGVVAVATIAAAAVTDPLSIGLYSWAVIAATFYGAVADMPIRHVAAVHAGSSAGRRMLRLYTKIAGALGVFFMAGSVILICSFVGVSPLIQGITVLAPLVVVPLAQATAVEPTALLQIAGHWRDISLCRTASSIAGALIGIPIVFFMQSILGASLAVAISEVAFTALLVLLTRRKTHHLPESGGRANDFWSTYRDMSVYSVLGWLQGQSERGFIGVWAGTSALGAYSLSSAIGRSAGEAIATSQANVLRIDLLNQSADNDDAIRDVLARNLRLVVPLAAISAIAVALIAETVFSRLLGPEWTSALAMVPILSLTAVPLAVAASSAPVHIRRGRSKVAYVGPALCLIFGPLIAIAALNSLTAAAWTVLIKECVLAATQSLFMGRATPWPQVIIAGLIVAVGAISILWADL